MGAGITADPKPNPEPEPKPNPKDIHIHLHGLKGVAGSGGMDGKMAEESGGIGDESAAEFGAYGGFGRRYGGWHYPPNRPYYPGGHRDPCFITNCPRPRQRTTWNFASPRTKSMVGLR